MWPKNLKMKNVVFFLVIIQLMFLSVNVAVADQVRIGVLAFRGEEMALKRWTATAEYLNEKIPAHNFTLVPLSLADLRGEVASGALDFIITNTGQYVELEVFYGVSRIATIKEKVRGKAMSKFGAVVFSRFERNDIFELRDLKGKSLMGVERNGFGGFQMAWREFKNQGIDVFADLAELKFSGFPQDQVAYAVRDGEVDAGTFRSGSLERLAAEGKIDLSEFRVLNLKNTPDYPLMHSTDLYPVWPIAKLKHTETRLAELVVQALLGMPQDHEAAKKARISGWTIPVNYQPVHELMMDLSVGPYASINKITLRDILVRYWPWLTALAFTLLILLLTTINLKRQVQRRKAVEVELIKHQQDLVEIVQEKTVDLVNARDEAMMANNSKEIFLSTMSHELRTPLNAIIGYCEILTEEKKELFSQEDISDLQNINVSAHQLLNIVDEILDINGIEQGTTRLQIHNFSVQRLFEKLLTEIEPLVEENNNVLEVHYNNDGGTMQSDYLRLQECLLQILHNACKFTKNGKIILQIRRIKGDPDTMEFLISDTGIGMSSEQQEQVFDTFTQVDGSSTRRYGGVGLGLSLARAYCDSMGGTISLVSELGKGSSFTISIPTKYIEPEKKTSVRQAVEHIGKTT